MALSKNLISVALLGLLPGKYQRGDRLLSLQAVIQRNTLLNNGGGDMVFKEYSYAGCNIIQQRVFMNDK
jgi:hypothetical protein